MKYESFFRNHPVFTYQEFADYAGARPGLGNRAHESTLAYYKKSGQILSLRQGLYATLPPGADHTTYRVDPFLITAHLTPDAILSHHTALAIRGRSYSILHSFFYISDSPIPPVHIQGHHYRGSRPPAALRRVGKQGFDVHPIDYLGQWIPVTGYERTLVDLLNKPQLWNNREDTWRSLQMIDLVNPDVILAYVELLNNQTLAAKVGFVLEQLRDHWLIDAKVLSQLAELAPAQPRYWMRSQREQGVLVSPWNLIVPDDLINQDWEEPL